MRFTAYHGSPGESFDRFDPKRSGSQSGYEHAVGVACFTSSVDVAREYAEGAGFIGRFAFELENPLEMDDSERGMGFKALLSMARDEGFDGVILRNCEHTAMSPGEASDIYFVFDLDRPRRIETVQEGERPRRRMVRR